MEKITTPKDGVIGSEQLDRFLQNVRTNGLVFKDHNAVAAHLRSFFETETRLALDSGSDLQRDYWIRAQARYMQQYKRFGYQDHDNLTTCVEGLCKSILARLRASESEPFYYQEPTSRTKDLDSLRGKVEKEASKLRRKGPVHSVSEAINMFAGRITDLSGVRILVYFPDDIPRVVDAIKNSVALEVLPNAVVVSYSKGRQDYRQRDKECQLEGGEINYLDGAFLEMSMHKDEIPKRWKNSGYRAVHLHVRKRAPELIIAKLQGRKSSHEPEEEGSEETSREPETISKENIYSSSEPSDTSSKDIGSDGPDDNWTFPAATCAEIQITTVVMHAWSQVEHDIIYRRPAHIRANPTMLRMLDGINGLAINSEIMLEELRSGLAEAQKEAEALDSKYFRDDPTRGSFRKILDREYSGDIGGWAADPLWAAILCDVVCAVDERRSWEHSPAGSEVSTPAKLRSFASAVLKGNHEEAMVVGIPIILLKALGERFERICLAPERNRFLPTFINILNPKPNLGFYALLYELLLAANAFSFMVVLGGEAEVDTFKGRFSDAEEKMSLINATVLGIKIPVHADTMAELVDFSRRFCASDLGLKHGLAVGLSRLWYCMSEDQERYRYADREGRVVEEISARNASYEEVVGCFGQLRCLGLTAPPDLGWSTWATTLWENASVFSAKYLNGPKLTIVSYSQMASLSLTTKSLKRLHHEHVSRQLELMSVQWQARI